MLTKTLTFLPVSLFIINFCQSAKDKEYSESSIKYFFLLNFCSIKFLCLYQEVEHGMQTSSEQTCSNNINFAHLLSTHFLYSFCSSFYLMGPQNAYQSPSDAKLL